MRYSRIEKRSSVRVSVATTYHRMYPILRSRPPEVPTSFHTFTPSVSLSMALTLNQTPLRTHSYNGSTFKFINNRLIINRFFMKLFKISFHLIKNIIYFVVSYDILFRHCIPSNDQNNKYIYRG